LLNDLPLWFACGTSDQFYPGNLDFVAILNQTPGVLAPETHFTAGSHSFEFWESAVPDQFRFLGAHL
jgi:S-formylglutathione hydrolase FrmB